MSRAPIGCEDLLGWGGRRWMKCGVGQGRDGIGGRQNSKHESCDLEVEFWTHPGSFSFTTMPARRIRRGFGAIVMPRCLICVLIFLFAPANLPAPSIRRQMHSYTCFSLYWMQASITEGPLRPAIQIRPASRRLPRRRFVFDFAGGYRARLQ
jgi:hypothetical protein